MLFFATTMKLQYLFFDCHIAKKSLESHSSWHLVYIHRLIFIFFGLGCISHQVYWKMQSHVCMGASAIIWSMHLDV